MTAALALIAAAVGAVVCWIAAVRLERRGWQSGYRAGLNVAEANADRLADVLAGVDDRPAARARHIATLAYELGRCGICLRPYCQDTHPPTTAASHNPGACCSPHVADYGCRPVPAHLAVDALERLAEAAKLDDDATWRPPPEA